MALTDKRQIFVDEYLQCWNASEAARRAGYAHPGAEGHRLLKNAEIQAEISRIVEERAMSRDEVLVRLADMARSDMSDFLEFKEGIKVPYLNLEQARERNRLHLIKKFKYNSDGLPEIELYSSYDALVQIGKAHSLFTDRVEQTGKDGEPIEHAIRVYLPDNDRD